MTALYDRIVAALDDWDDYEHEGEAGKRRVAADRRVLARHEAFASGFDRPDDCRHDGYAWPCPDVLDLCARYDVEVTP